MESDGVSNLPCISRILPLTPGEEENASTMLNMPPSAPWNPDLAVLNTKSNPPVLITEASFKPLSRLLVDFFVLLMILREESKWSTDLANFSFCIFRVSARRRHKPGVQSQVLTLGGCSALYRERTEARRGRSGDCKLRATCSHLSINQASAPLQALKRRSTLKLHLGAELSRPEPPPPLHSTSGDALRNSVNRVPVACKHSISKTPVRS